MGGSWKHTTNKIHSWYFLGFFNPEFDLFPTTLCGVLDFRSVPPVFRLSRPSAASLSHTIFHTQICHTQLCHTPSSTYIFVTHHLSHTTLSHTHTTLSHTIFHTQTPSFTHLFENLSHTVYLFVTHHLSHTCLSHTLFHTHPLSHTPSFTHPLSHTPSFTHHLSLTFHTPPLSHTIYIHLRFAWHSWCLWRLAGSGDALGPRWSPVTPHHFAWQAWQLVTSTGVLRGRRGTLRHPPSFCVAGVVLMALWHTQLLHTPSLSHTIFHPPSLSHTIFHTPSLSHTIFHTQLCHTQLCYTHTHTHIFTYKCFSDQSSTTSFVYPSFPIPLELLFLLIGRNWLVGLSGPLILRTRPWFSWVIFLDMEGCRPNRASTWDHHLNSKTYSFKQKNA